MRRVIAQRLTEVKPGVPHFYLTIDVEMDAAMKIRDEAKAQDLKVSVNDIVVKATAVAVRRFPRINQIFAGDHIEQLHTVDVGVAVAIEDGLITPLVRDADQKGIAEIAGEVRELAERARRKALKPEEYTGGSITVSNLGMFGIDSFIAVLNPPQAAILAVGRVEPKVVVRNDQMVIRQMMSITLSGDHRVIDGAVGAQYLQELRSLLEHPLRLVF
jgi:pyruvate dehydrogenase E2 component (dihydrolipoamide acetyltransferase)